MAGTYMQMQRLGWSSSSLLALRTSAGIQALITLQFKSMDWPPGRHGATHPPPKTLDVISCTAKIINAVTGANLRPFDHVG
ncbi:hypothetical protein B0I35DRAFT_436891 [Stachybotrys elegans]|uniref:Uncharacterized protein n=1 Tax=Stachybotrys elegans TaxID=80388 RepID=A0A8K0WNL5_9HYPO|nr:hypothetical protein B0I35DRAFT_436891 [Stachybotrys elegans]